MNPNPLVQILGMAFNLLMSPFAGDGTSDNSIVAPSPPPASAGRSAEGSGLFSMCNNVLFKMGENELKVSFAPRGYCPNCCPMQMGIDLRFILYNKQYSKQGILIHPANETGAAQKAGVNREAPTEIFIHGFTEPSPGQSGRTVVDAYLSRPEAFNVILVDWSNLATFPWYRPAVQNVKIVAEALKNFLETFNDSGEIPIENVHIVGFSLGSHIASFTGKLLRQGLKIPRITALDPALPEYSLIDTSRRLTRSDADYVDVIHTDSGVLGIPISVGHADFYPNGGRALQPGCQPSYLVQINLLDQIPCSHVRAWRLYAESVRNPEAFPATKCRVWRGPNKTCNFTQDAFMGFGSVNKDAGQFFLMTDHKTPFGKSAARQTNQR